MNIYTPQLSKYLSALERYLDRIAPSDDLKIIEFPLPPEEVKEEKTDKAA